MIMTYITRLHYHSITNIIIIMIIMILLVHREAEENENEIAFIGEMYKER